MNTDDYEHDAAVALLLQEQFDREERALRQASNTQISDDPSTPATSGQPAQSSQTGQSSNRTRATTPENSTTLESGPDWELTLTNADRWLHQTLERVAAHHNATQTDTEEPQITAAEITRFMSQHVRSEEGEAMQARVEAARAARRASGLPGTPPSPTTSQLTLEFPVNEHPMLRDQAPLSTPLESRIESENHAIDTANPPPRRRHLARVDDFADIKVIRSKRLRDCMMAVIAATLTDSSERVRHSPAQLMRLFRSLPPQEMVRFAYFLRDHEYDTHVYLKRARRDSRWRLYVRVEYDRLTRVIVVPMHPREGHPQNAEDSGVHLTRPDRGIDSVHTGNRDLRGRLQRDVWWHPEEGTVEGHVEESIEEPGEHS